MKETGDLYFDQQRLMDLRVVSTLGLTEEDVELLARQEGVEEAEGAYTIDAAVPLKDQEMIVKVHSFAEEGSNRPRLVEGRLPPESGGVPGGAPVSGEVGPVHRGHHPPGHRDRRL